MRANDKVGSEVSEWSDGSDGSKARGGERRRRSWVLRAVRAPRGEYLVAPGGGGEGE